MSKDNGGPAFPWNGEMNRDLQELSGMTLRDYFAAKAMQAQMSIPDVYDAMAFHGVTLGDVAIRAYDIADAMLAERSK